MIIGTVFLQRTTKSTALCNYQREEGGPRNGGFPGKPQKLAQLSI